MQAGHTASVIPDGVIKGILLPRANRRLGRACNLTWSQLSFPLAVGPTSRSTALTAEAANGCVTHMSAGIGRLGRNASKSPRSGLRRERRGNCCAASWPRSSHARVGAEGTGGPEGPADMDGSVVAVAMVAVAAGVAALLTAVVATAVAAAAPASVGDAAAREKTVSKT